MRETGSVLCQTALWDCFGNASFIGYYKVVRETGSVLCQTALWDCFGNAIASFIGYYKVARETGSVLCQTALWNCLGALSLLLLAITTLRRKLVRCCTKSTPWYSCRDAISSS